MHSFIFITTTPAECGLSSLIGSPLHFQNQDPIVILAGAGRPERVWTGKHEAM